MRLGTEFPPEWKEKSQKENIALADILYGYAIEDIMQRISKSSVREYLWLTNENALGEEAYRRKAKIRLEFLYVEKEKRFELLEKELFSDKKDSDIRWHCCVNIKEKGAEFSLIGNFKEMQVPVSLWMDTSQKSIKKAKEKKRSLFTDEKKNITYFSYAKESILAEEIFEIMKKLELISDMGCYDRANEILKNYSISGRYVLEDLKEMGEKAPKVLTMKRLQQVSDYKKYGYMKKKWQQYAKNRREQYDDWEIVIGRMEKFLAPIWTALCEDEIFFDDWMPELERFLG